MKKLFFIIYAAAVMISAIGCDDTFYDVYNEFTGPVQKVELRDSASVVIDTTERLYATVYPSMTENKNVTWSSADPSIASVDENGVVTGKILNGSTTITVTTEDGRFTDECIVTVVPVPVPMQTLTLPATQTIGTNQQRILTPDFTPPGATSIEMTWSSSNSAVAAVEASPDGGRSATITGVVEGSAVITATSVRWGISASCTVTVGEPTYVVKYDANGGSGTIPVDNVEYKNGDSVTVASSASLSRPGYSFSHWNTEMSGSGASRAPGSTYGITSVDVTFYAQWTLLPPAAPAAPTLTAGNLQIFVSWTPVQGATSYEVRYNTTDDSGTALQQGGDITSGTSCTLTSLTNGTQYFVWIKAKNSAGSSDFSAVAAETIGVAPTVITTAIVGNLTFTVLISGTSAIGGGNVTNQGSAAVTGRGLCWNTTGNPTTSDLTVPDGSGTGSFANASMTSLTTNTTYYVRAYATNSHNKTSYGNEITFNSGKTFGTTYAGGLVFYNNGSGGGLVAAIQASEWSSKQWGKSGTLVSGTGTAIGTGSSNTTKIVAVLNAPTATSGKAAQLCDALSSNGYDDWFLPSKDELNLMYYKLKVNGFGSFASVSYWSSSESTNYVAGRVVFGPYDFDYVDKANSASVRAARSF